MLKIVKKTVPSKKPQWFLDDNGRILAATVEAAAGSFNVSERRIRQMLATGVLAGTKHGRVWHVTHPYRIALGTRGPLSSAFTSRGYTRSVKDRRKSSKFINSKIKKGD
jgi:hypothetical protein